MKQVHKLLHKFDVRDVARDWCLLHRTHHKFSEPEALEQHTNSAFDSLYATHTQLFQRWQAAVAQGNDAAALEADLRSTEVFKAMLHA